MTHKQIITAGLLIGGIIFIGVIAVFLLITSRPSSDILIKSESKITDNTDSADNRLGCENRVTPFTKDDYTYSLSKNALKITTSENFPIKLNLEGDFTVDQTDPAWPFTFKGKIKGNNLYLYQGLMMNRYDDACAKVMKKNTEIYHSLVDKDGVAYWQKVLGETLIKNGQEDIKRDGQIYYWYLLTDTRSSNLYGGKYYYVLTSTYKNGVDYRFSSAFNGTSLDMSDMEDMDLAVEAALKTVALFQI